MTDKRHDEFKDRLLENVSTAIKQLQIESCYDKVDMQFTGNMWQVQELCVHLDGTLNHGLKQLPGGYWPFVRELTHKNVTSLILDLPRAVSNVVRGWAWLYLALNDHALESYIRTIISHPKITERHYLPHALLRDTQRLQVLVMMSAGLEHVSFQLDPNNACISGWKAAVNEKENEQCDDEDDDDVEEAECASLASCTSSQDSQGADDDPELGIIMIVTIDPKTGLPVTENIIHSSKRSKRKKERPNGILNNNNEIPILPEEIKIETIKEDVNVIHPLANGLSKIHVTAQDRELFLNSILHNEIYSEQVENDSAERKKANPSKEFPEEASVYDNSYCLPKESDPSGIQAPFPDDTDSPVVLRQNNSSRAASAKRVSFDPDNLIQYMNDPSEVNTSLANESETNVILSMSERGAPEGQEDPMSSSTASLNYPLKDISKAAVSAKQNELFNQAWEMFPKPIFVDKSIVETSVKQLDDAIKSEIHLAHGQMRECVQGEVPLENNFHLMIMLEVVVDQDEKVYKVFQANIDHTMGTPMDVYVVLTDKRFYLSHLGLNCKHHKVVASLLYSEIEFVQLSLNYQIINVVCVSPRRRFWICTGDEEVTRNIITSLEVAIRRSPNVVSLPCVFTDSTMQSIAICKWVAKETGCEANKVAVDHYSLIKWEDPHVMETITSPIGPTKEGDLMYRYADNSVFGTKNWHPGYFRLKGGVCYRFADILDRTFRSYEQLVGGACVGCRHVSIPDRPHTFELILTENRILQFAAPSETEASEWLQVFLQAVSQGFTEPERIPQTSACLILASQKLFICHEELETHFIRSLGKAEVQDVSIVHTDPTGAPYCILEFESVEATETCCDWALHFASTAEMAKFHGALSEAWLALFQVPLPVNEITGSAKQKRSQL